MLIGTFLDLNKNELRNAAIQNLSSAPSSAATAPIGQIYSDTSDANNTAVKVNLKLAGTNTWVQLATGSTAMANPMTTLGDTIVGAASGVPQRLAGNITASRQFLMSVGNGSAANALIYDALAASDITSGTLAVNRGGTNKASWTQYGLAYADTTTSLSQITEVTTGGKALVSSVSGAPVFGKVILTQPTTAATITFTTDNTTLTVANTASVSGTNTGDVTLATNTGLAFTSGQTGLYLGTPSTITTATTNSVTTNTHTHAITGLIAQAGSTNFTGGTTNIATGATLNVQSGGSLTVASGATFQTSATPSAATDVVNKGYVDTLAQGTPMKPTARLATSGVLSPANTYANGSSGVGATLTATGVGILTVDGINTVLDNIILVKNEASGLKNGLYKVTTEGTAGVAYVLTRVPGMDIATEFSGGVIPVETEGTDNKNTFWMCTNLASPTVGTTSITFGQLNGATSLIQGSGITISGNTVSAAFSVTATDIKMNGTQSLGALNTLPRADHVHPSDTTKANLSGAAFTGALSLDASLGIAIAAGAPGVTTNKIYNVGGSLYFNGAALSTGSGTVTSVDTAAANNGVTATWANTTTAARLTIGLAAITPTSVNGLTISGSAGTLTIPTGSTLVTSGAFSTTLVATATTVATLPAGTKTLMATDTTVAAGQLPALTGDVTTTAGTVATTVVRLNGTSLAGLASGLLYNTTTTGVPSIATSAQVITTLGYTPPKKYATTFTGTGPTFVINHNLNTKDITVALYDASDNYYITDYVCTTVNSITLSFGYGVPGAATHRCVVIG